MNMFGLIRRVAIVTGGNGGIGLGMAWTGGAFGRLDILVNNAGIGVATNLSSAFWLSQAAYPELKRAGRGKIINIGSMMSIFGASLAAAYAASKGGLVQLTKALAPGRPRTSRSTPCCPAGSTRTSPGWRATTSIG